MEYLYTLLLFEQQRTHFKQYVWLDDATKEYFCFLGPHAFIRSILKKKKTILPVAFWWEEDNVNPEARVNAEAVEVFQNVDVLFCLFPFLL